MEKPSTMDKKNQFRPLLCKNNQDSSKSDYSIKKSGQQYPKKRENEKFDTGKRSSTNRAGRAGQRYVRPREKVGGQVEENKEGFSEFGSLQRSGSKKQNITHLLNWWGPSPDRHSYEHHGGGRGGSHHRKGFSTHVKFNKEHYLQANCQFVVSTGHDYSSYKNDPDHLVDWDLVEEVRIHVSEDPTCPICLHPPVASKVTRCGHIYCFPCILHYLALTDEKWRKCPICFDAIMKNELKSAVTIQHKDLSAGDEIEFTLMRRERDSLIAIPVSSYAEDLPHAVASLSSPEAVLSYANLILASNNEVNNHIVKRELCSLEYQLGIEGDQPEACFIQEALSLVTQRQATLDTKSNDNRSACQSLDTTPTVSKRTDPSNTSSTDAADLSYLADKIEQVTIDKAKPMEERSVGLQSPTSPTGDVEIGRSPIHPDDLDIGQLQGSNIKTSSDARGAPKSTFYFYQESSGAHVYLHALNVHMLVKDYGSLENCPHTIKAKVLEKESASMDCVLRQRLRYLRHLPISCPFEVVEIEMKQNLVSILTLAEYKGQLDARSRKRKKRAKQEHQIERRVLLEEDRMMGRSRGHDMNTSSYSLFPSISEEPLFPSPTLGPQTLNSAEEESICSSSVGSLTEDVIGSSLCSFAQMISGRQQTISTPRDTSVWDFPSLGKTSGAYSISRVVTPMKQEKGERGPRPPSSLDGEEEEEAERVPDFSSSFSQAFSKALDQACTTEGADGRSKDGDAKTPRGKKGKKKKGIILLSSGGR